MGSTPRPTARGLRTRERLLDAAERLWSERGVDGVSLREIRLAAGQRNSSALQFHFGDREGLLLALTDRHLPKVTAIQEQLYARLVAEGRQDDLVCLVEVMVRPPAEYLRRGPSERAWTRITAQLITRPDISVQDILDHAPAIALHVGATLHERLAETMDPALAGERLMSVMFACGHLCADRARLEDSPPPDDPQPMRPLLSFDVWVTNLLDMAVAALLAPPRQ
jgi:AcrR family transcriptional regulator